MKVSDCNIRATLIAAGKSPHDKSKSGLLVNMEIFNQTLAYVTFLPDDFVANKGSYYRFGFGLLQPNFHLTAHVQQIKDVIAASRK